MANLNLRKFILIAIVVIVLILAFVFSGTSKFDGPYTEYQCDVKNFSLSTTIEIDKAGEDFATVKGNIFKIVTDPLTMYDLEGNKYAYADDTYHLIAQDSHMIFVDDTLTAEMVGLVEVFGEEYDIYDGNSKKIAKVTFDAANTNGKMYGIENNLIADFNSKLFLNDFTVRIAKDCNIDEKTVLMIFCSYYSDQHADAESSS